MLAVPIRIVIASSRKCVSSHVIVLLDVIGAMRPSLSIGRTVLFLSLLSGCGGGSSSGTSPTGPVANFAL